MTFSSWTWLHVLVMALVYWAVVICTWSFRVSRPAARERARERAFHGRTIDPATGEMTMTFTSAIDVNRIAAILLGPPLFLVLTFLLLKGG